MDLVGPLNAAAEHFSSCLFEGALPTHAITLQRRLPKDSLFIPCRWQDISGIVRHEIALNPTRFARQPLLLVLQSIVREQSHLWQFVFGSPTRPGYHNREWAEKVASLGFQVSVDGHPNRITGQKISLKPVADGPFVAACAQLVRQHFVLTWLDRGFDPERKVCVPMQLPNIDTDVRKVLTRPLGAAFGGVTSIRDLKAGVNKRKIKYGCPSCGVNVWGRSGLSLSCSSCNLPLTKAA